MTPLDVVRRRLAWFAEREAAGVSPLYEHLGRGAADDPEVAGLLTAAEERFAHGTLLLAAAHRLVQAEPFHPLSSYYPSLGGTHGVDERTWPLFREFVLERADRMRALIASRTTQTNEVRRAALVYPAVAAVNAAVRGPVGLLEVGCSAGLLLNLDKYGYRYQTEQAGQLAAGPAKAAVGLHCALELAPGARLPKLPKSVKVAAKVGLDRAPADLADEDTYAWLEACVWADQPERLRLFGVAAAVQRKSPPEFVVGDAVADLGRAAARVPDELPLVVLTSSVLAYLEGERFVAALAGLGRPVWWISHEGFANGLVHVLPDREDLRPGPGGGTFGVLGLVRFEGGEVVRAQALARTALHGQRLVWLPETP
ncbi:DUF2332 domain-containing protein [Saccharothrix coeruleofusca]|uniref:DUF2332 domain-containing protein n=1 Tax=Saccharothrix coeruleofusca TaxID=33919 RepID=A0A918APW4_9PSEU|nr:DUF2332 domain-containing protein [Saccharothrix coeruleofusca]MBP2340948.1 hypothetical protein [Saccharothrix coeruleofusca]GGP61016.1 hypothetical protein GCM10010185_36890 [Saccharothrix coeruleofusca]